MSRKISKHHRSGGAEGADSGMWQHNFIKQDVCANTISDLKVDASFRKIAKNVICFHIWKIDEDRLEAVTKTAYGTFYDDSAYIIYAACCQGAHVNQDTITRETKAGTNLERYIHFWLGEKVSEQKRSNVAHKIQELDSYFGNVATEFRETQDNESARFLAYFTRGISIRCGALVSSTEPNRLFQLRGRKWLRCIEMPEISWSHFSANYIMLLKTGEQLFAWIGRSSSAIERRDAIELVSRPPWPSTFTIVDDGYEQSMPDVSKSVWNAHLPLSQRTVNQTVVATPEHKCTGKLKLYRCAYRSGRLHLDQLDVAMPQREDFSDSTTVYVLDVHGQAVWLWVGKETKQAEIIGAMGNGRAFIKKKKYPYCTPVIRVVEGHEPLEFKRLFPSSPSNWYEQSSISLKPISTKLGRFDSLTLCQRPKMAASTQLIDDGSGERTIFRITKEHVVELPPTKTVIFTTQYSYMVHYMVVLPSASSADVQNTGIKSIVYQWNGSEAPADVSAKCGRLAKQKFETSQQSTMFVQMNEFDETPHFLQLFDGCLIVLQSSKPNAVATSNNHNNNHIDTAEHFVLKVFGDASYNSKAVEVFPMTAMNSKECYVVRTNHVWVWCGQSSTGDARELAKNVGALLGESSLVLEGKEPKEFWRSVANQMNQPAVLSATSSVCSNGSGNINNGNTSPCGGVGYLCGGIEKIRPTAQLYLVWAQQGSFCCAEIMAYEQRDLATECVYVLDAGLITYIWLGGTACSYEKENYMNMVQHYLETVVPLARRPTTAIAVVRQHDEPNVFKGFFEQWDYDLWDNYQSYEKKRQAIFQPLLNFSNGVNGGTCSSTVTPMNGSDNANKIKLPPALMNHQKDFDRHHKYPIATLQQEIDLLPTEVNPLKREVHLTHDDFVSVFRMSFWEFDDLPAWKKQELKKKHKLF